MISPMRLKLLASFLTFVLCSVAFSAPDTQVYPTPIDNLKSQEQTQTPSQENVDLESLQISPTAGGENSLRPLPLRARLPIKTTDFAVAFAQGQFEKTHSRLEGGIFSVGRTIFQDEKSAWNFSAGLFTPTGDSFLVVDGGMKIILEDFLRFEPYYKVSLSGFYEPKDQLGNFIDFKKYFVGFFFGFENLLNQQRSLKAEVGAQTGYSGTHVLGRLIYGL